MNAKTPLNRNQFARLVLAIALAGLAIFGSLSLLPGADQVEAAPAGAPAVRTIVINTAAITADTNTSGVIWAAGFDPHTKADVFLAIDQGTTNTTTFKLQVSPDNSNWFDAVTLVSANAADANTYTTTDVIGQYFRINADVTNSNAITPVIKVVLR